ncbi:MAG: hypothetical protein KGH60_02020 [Candidatus Micrarchaeota archaeon]|nr:hypothetical protein [Candidatus Micrarchaeota archaeon]
MSLSTAIKAIDAATKTYTTLMCEYCGKETFAVHDMAMCTGCESLVHLTRKVVQLKNPGLAGSLDTINRLVEAGEHEKAAQIYEKLYADTKDPQLLYAEALLYTKYSNYETSMISYDKQGFMDENIALRDSSLKQVSASKKLLAKLIYIARGNVDKNIISINTLYSLFLAQLKFGDVRGAKRSLEMLSNLNNDYVHTYASMVFENAMGNYDSVIKNAEALLTQNSFSINAAYYLAFAWFKKGRIGDAKKLINAAQGYLGSDTTESLVQDMEEYGTY